MDNKMIARELLKAAKELTAGKAVVICRYHAVGGYSMSDVSASHGIRADVTLSKQMRDSFILRFEGSAFDITDVHMTGARNEDVNDFNKTVRVNDGEENSSRDMAILIEDAMKKICKRNDKNYQPKQWVLPNKGLRMNQTGQSLKYVLGRTLKKAVAILED